jgi:hypothetical protein
MISPAIPQNIEYWPIERLVQYPRNPRNPRKNDAAVDRMCGSIREFGFKIPILARSDGEVIDGHLRLKPPASSAFPRSPYSCATNGLLHRFGPSGC